MELPQQLSLGGAAALVAWYYRDTIKAYASNLLPFKGGSPGKRRLSALSSLESAQADAKALSNEKASRCIDEACKAFYEPCEGKDDGA